MVGSAERQKQDEQLQTKDGAEKMEIIICIENQETQGIYTADDERETHKREESTRRRERRICRQTLQIVRGNNICKIFAFKYPIDLPRQSFCYFNKLLRQ